jgi:hypothetical protein
MRRLILFLVILVTYHLISSDCANAAPARSLMKAAQLSCNTNAARICQRQIDGCYDICNHGIPGQRSACHAGCQQRYDDCKANAGCRSY